MAALELGAHFFLQLTVILGTCRAVGWLGRRFLGQSQVVMEMVAGVLLGPSLLGVAAPQIHAWLFPRQIPAAGVAEGLHPSMAILYAASQLGLVLYMFLVGLELNADYLRGRLARVGLISVAGVAAPFALGGIIALVLIGRGGFFAPGVPSPTAVVYLGAAMSVTAFPMLARILHEQGLTGTRLGTLTLTAGCVSDAVAWCLLAVVLAMFQSSPGRAVWAVGGGALYALLMLGPGRALLGWLADRHQRLGGLTADSYTSVMLVLTSGALVTELLGIYAVFGAFLVGIAMPRGSFAEAVAQRTGLPTTSLLLPLFFVFSGLHTRLWLVDSAQLWGITAVVVLAAVAGKGVACALAARASGESWRDAASIGALMNARGLMELMILNIALEHHLITPTLFTIMVLMTVVTTLVASPLYHLLNPRRPGSGSPGAEPARG